MKNKVIKKTFEILNCMYLMACIAGLYIVLPFWNFYRYLCKIGEKKYNEYFN
jgi:uncharacterized iron-regulated membrane protein